MQYTTEETKKEIGQMLTQYFMKGEDGKLKVSARQALPLLLIGPAGIGKTQIVESIAKEKKLGFVSYSLVHHTRQTLMGLPVITNFDYQGQSVKDTEYTLSEVLGAVAKQVEVGFTEGILLLDEANTAPESIQPILLSFLQSKTLGNNQLPDGWVIILCGNPPKSIYNRNAKAWDGALMDRLRVIEMQLDNEEYLEYVYKNDFHPVIRFYLTMYTDDAYICKDEDGKFDLVTYRTWENLSNAMKEYEELGFDISEIFINQFVKVDRVVKALYNLYSYTHLDPDKYSGIIRSANEDDYAPVGRLGGTPTEIQYGISNLYFNKLNRKANELFQLRSYLKKFKETVLDKEISLNQWMQEERLDDALQNQVEATWQEIQKENALDAGTLFHKALQQRLHEEADLQMQNTESFLSEVVKNKERLLDTYFVNTMKRSSAWLYLLAGTSHPVFDELQQRK